MPRRAGGIGGVLLSLIVRSGGDRAHFSYPRSLRRDSFSGMYEIMENLRAGDHAALFYKSRAEQLAIAIPFIAIGLKRGERCLYIADDNSVAMIINELEKSGVDVTEAEKSGALTVSTKHHTYLRHG